MDKTIYGGLAISSILLGWKIYRYWQRPIQAVDVIFVGAGPGPAKLLTRWGHEVLASADVVLVDALVHPSVYQDTIPRGCQVIPVGKRAGQPSMSQPEINALLVHHAQAPSRNVVRLKGGDPMIFGRIVSEIEALQAAHCTFEIIPGISSAMAAAAHFGLPLTHARHSKSFLVLSGHDAEALDYALLVQMDTLVIFMGTRNLWTIARQLQAYGRDPHTPVRIMHHNVHPKEWARSTTLAQVEEVVEPMDRSPAIIVIGKVAAF